MKTVIVEGAERSLATLLEEVARGEEVTIARDGTPVATLSAAPRRIVRQPGILKTLPGWEDFRYDPSIFAPMTDEEMAAEGWPV